MILYVSDIEQKFEDETISNETREVVKILAAAINDWPEISLSVEDYESHLRKFIKGEVKRDSLKMALKKINLNTDAWKAESITQAIEVFDFFKEGLSLKEIVDEVKIRLADNS
jgi:hypothetical protein